MIQPVRVAVLTSGPQLGAGVCEFLRRLELQPDIELVAVFWQTGCRHPGVRAVIADLWRRRRWLAGPLLVQRYLGQLLRLLAHPVRTLATRRLLQRLQPRVFRFRDLHAGVALDAVRRQAPALLLVYGAPIIRETLFSLAPLGTLGIHHGKVPEYRGKKTLFWAMYHDEPAAGVTIQRINATLDGGDVVKAGEVPVGLRLPWQVWRELEQLGFRLYLEAVLEVGQGRAEYRPQQGAARALCRDPAPVDIARFWLRYARRVLRWLAGKRGTAHA